MLDEDWGDLEEEILNLLSDTGMATVVDDYSNLVSKFVEVLKRKYRSAMLANDDDDRED